MNIPSKHGVDDNTERQEKASSGSMHSRQSRSHRAASDEEHECDQQVAGQAETNVYTMCESALSHSQYRNSRYNSRETYHSEHG